MSIQLVGEPSRLQPPTVKARDRAPEPVVRGAYLDAETDFDPLLPEHVVRIAHYTYPATYLNSVTR